MVKKRKGTVKLKGNIMINHDMIGNKHTKHVQNGLFPQKAGFPVRIAQIPIVLLVKIFIKSIFYGIGQKYFQFIPGTEIIYDRKDMNKFQITAMAIQNLGKIGSSLSAECSLFL